MEIQLMKKAIEDTAFVTKAITLLGGTYVAIEGSLGKYQSRIKGLNVEFTLNSLSGIKDFSFNYLVEKGTAEQLGALSKGKGPVGFLYGEDRQQYEISNGAQKVCVKHIVANFMMPSIDVFIESAHAIGVPIAINSKGQIGINGKAKSVKIVIRDQTFTSVIIEGQGEHFLIPMSRESMEIHKPLALGCNNFLAIGREKFILQVYQQERQYWLLTKVNPGTGIQSRVLEKLNSI